MKKILFVMFAVIAVSLASCKGGNEAPVLGAGAGTDTTVVDSIDSVGVDTVDVDTLECDI